MLNRAIPCQVCGSPYPTKWRSSNLALHLIGQPHLRLRTRNLVCPTRTARWVVLAADLCPLPAPIPDLDAGRLNGVKSVSGDRRPTGEFSSAFVQLSRGQRPWQGRSPTVHGTRAASTKPVTRLGHMSSTLLKGRKQGRRQCALHDAIPNLGSCRPNPSASGRGLGLCFVEHWLPAITGGLGLPAACDSESLCQYIAFPTRCSVFCSSTRGGRITAGKGSDHL
jgi:hypothetical protein